MHGIVCQAQGHIWVYSELGHGTVFKIYLPRAQDGQLKVSLPAPPIEPQGGAETILLVEDDQLVREAACAVLRAKGYHVIAAPHATDAVELLRSPQPIDLLLTDIILPGMNGPELARLAQRLRPSCCCSTCPATPNHSLGEGVLEKGIELLQKPFTPRSLARKVREVLDAKAAPR